MPGCDLWLVLRHSAARGAVFVVAASALGAADVSLRRPADRQRCWHTGEQGRLALPWPTIG